jgi:hypothetical protein
MEKTTFAQNKILYYFKFTKILIIIINIIFRIKINFTVEIYISTVARVPRATCCTIYKITVFEKSEFTTCVCADSLFGVR